MTFSADPITRRLMTLLFISITIIVSIILQTTVINYLAIFSVKPELLIIITVYFSLVKGSLSGEVIGFTGGLLEDVFAINLVGINAFTKTIIGYTVGKLKNNIDLENFITPFIIVGMVTFLEGILFYIIRLFFGQEMPFFNCMAMNLGRAIYNGVLAPFVFRLLSRFEV